MNTLQQKLNRANGILAKLRYYVKADVLQTIYYAFLEYHMRLKNNSLKITSFQTTVCLSLIT